MEETSLKLTVDAGDAIEKMDAFAHSANAAANAIERLESAFGALAGTLKTLNGAPHGGITFEMVCDVARAEIKPAGGSKPPSISADNARGTKVFLDGVQVEHVIAVDPDLGYILVLPEPGDNYMPFEFNGTVCKRLYGAITFVAP